MYSLKYESNWSFVAPQHCLTAFWGQTNIKISVLSILSYMHIFVCLESQRAGWTAIHQNAWDISNLTRVDINTQSCVKVNHQVWRISICHIYNIQCIVTIKITCYEKSCVSHTWDLLVKFLRVKKSPCIPFYKNSMYFYNFFKKNCELLTNSAI